MKNNNRRRHTEIPNGESYSDPINIHDLSPRSCEVFIAAGAWTAANLIIEVSEKLPGRTPIASNDPSWGVLHNEDKSRAVIEIDGVEGGSFPAPATTWSLGTYSWMRFRSVSAADPTVPVAQGATRSISVGLMY